MKLPLEYLKIIKKNLSFTLVELIVVMALISFLFTLTLPISIRFLQGQRIQERAITLTTHLKIAQARAVAEKQDGSWGIKINHNENTYTLFQGDSYTGRNETYDQEFELAVDSSGTDEIVFNQLTGNSTASETILTLEQRTITIKVNTEGRINII